MMTEMDKLYKRGILSIISVSSALCMLLAITWYIGTGAPMKKTYDDEKKYEYVVRGNPSVRYVFDESLITDKPEANTVEYEAPGCGTYLGVFKCTAYCPCEICSEGYGRMTATGAIARSNHTVAVDPRVIPYGTRLLIGGIVYVAEDCGGLVNGNVIDIFFDTHGETYQWGARYLDVYIER